jgi:hypothetical protein
VLAGPRLLGGLGGTDAFPVRADGGTLLGRGTPPVAGAGPNGKVAFIDAAGGGPNFCVVANEGGFGTAGERALGGAGAADGASAGGAGAASGAAGSSSIPATMESGNHSGMPGCQTFVELSISSRRNRSSSWSSVSTLTSPPTFTCH